MMKVRNETRKVLVAKNVERATELCSRMKGLLGRNELAEGHGLWIDRCNSIHTFFMRFPIDAIFISNDNKVVRTYEHLKPNRLTRLVFGASSVLELPAGTLKQFPVRVGDHLRVEAS